MTQPHQLGYGFAGGSRYGNYYRHSGQVNLGGLVGASLIGLIAAFAIGWVYTFSDIYIPIPKLNALACVGFGLAMGAIPATILKKMKVRNVPVSLAVVGVVAAFGLYTSWAAWEWWELRRLTDISFIKLFMRPMALVRIAQAINAEGTWRMSEHDTENTKGVFLGVIWALEALSILITAPLVARGMIGGKPFCEKCDQWCDGPAVVRRTAPVEISALRQKLEAGDYNFVTALAGPNGGQFTEFQRHHCGKCGQLNTLSVVSHKITRDKKGRVRGNKKKTLVNKLLISADDLKKITAPQPSNPA